MSTINKERKKILTQLDNIIFRIQKKGSDGADQQEIFKTQPSEDLIKSGNLNFVDSEHPTQSALEYLIQEGYVYKTNHVNISKRETYALTFKGLLRTRPNTFVDEYEKEVQRQTLIKRDFDSKYITNTLAVILSILAILTSLVSILK